MFILLSWNDHAQSLLLTLSRMSVSSPWHRTRHAAGSYGGWGHLFLCGVWIQGARPSCSPIFSAWLAVPGRWEHSSFCCDHTHCAVLTLHSYHTVFSMYQQRACVCIIFFCWHAVVFYCKLNLKWNQIYPFLFFVQPLHLACWHFLILKLRKRVCAHNWSVIVLFCFALMPCHVKRCFVYSLCCTDQYGVIAQRCLAELQTPSACRLIQDWTLAFKLFQHLFSDTCISANYIFTSSPFIKVLVCLFGFV